MVNRQADPVRKGWWALDVASHIDLALSGIYEWRIGEHSLYVGKSKRLRQRINEYPNNIRKMLVGAPYRRGKQTAYRNIHHELRRAHDDLMDVTVSILENCETSQLNEREQHWIAVRKSEAERGGPRVLNGTSSKPEFKERKDMLIKEDFETELHARFQRATERGAGSVDINSGELHRSLGGYPSAKHQMPTCCTVMNDACRASDEIVATPPSGKGASLTIRYQLPR
ncbi:hypothetical protein GRI44_13755 [Altererythrobacter confluentis]|uniref:GIY-YIG domain-containing protein n=1 Tax=Allopontixanthobacter confluentis TaxID=1849021 RepID=A0A6L7GKJ7_9SPHN|nr:hypothetical protein [Allopontixanthobacter confluentis]MXP15814.1 hypothetical protein [Allopontixanthobacter confluentis]